MVVRNRELIARHERNVREAIIEIAVTRSLPLDESKNLIVIMRTRNRAAHPPRALVWRRDPRHRHPSSVQSAIVRPPPVEPHLPAGSFLGGLRTRLTTRGNVRDGR